MDAIKALCVPGERSIPSYILSPSTTSLGLACVVLAEQEEERFSLFSLHEWELSDSLNTVGGKFRAPEGTYIPPPCISVFFASETNKERATSLLPRDFVIPDCLDGDTLVRQAEDRQQPENRLADSPATSPCVLFQPRLTREINCLLSEFVAHRDELFSCLAGC